MKNVLLSLTGFLFTPILFGQCDTMRYQNGVFNQVYTHQNVKYGESPVWSIPYNNTDLYMDIYEPIGDSLTKRPLMIWVHSGGFLNGNKEHDDMVALCDSFARRGYVTASISYRLGFNPLSEASAERAVYRGTQDTRAAIRYLKEYHNIYNIDTNFTFLGGSSAGGFATMHTAYLDQNEAPNSIEGTWASPDLGCLDCEGNNYQHNMDLSAIVNLWGALGDSSWINVDETVPALLVHGTDDGTVPFGVGHPFGVITTPITHGSRSVGNQLDFLGIDHTQLYFQGEDHEPHGTDNGTWNNPPTPYWDTIFDAINHHYFEVLRPSTQPINGPLEICEGDTVTYYSSSPNNGDLCWQSNAGVILDTENDSIEIVWENDGSYEIAVIPFNHLNAAGNRVSEDIIVHSLPIASFTSNQNQGTVDFIPDDNSQSSYLWDFGDGETSTEVAPTHVFENGLYEVTLTVINSNGCSQQFTEEIDMTQLSLISEDLDLKIYPQPANDKIYVESTQNIRELIITSSSGQIVSNLKDIPSSTDIDVSYLSNGIYFMSIQTRSGKTSNHKLMIAR